MLACRLRPRSSPIIYDGDHVLTFTCPPFLHIASSHRHRRSHVSARRPGGPFYVPTQLNRESGRPSQLLNSILSPPLDRDKARPKRNMGCGDPEFRFYLLDRQSGPGIIEFISYCLSLLFVTFNVATAGSVDECVGFKVN
jgi:hypothetical protein